MEHLLSEIESALNNREYLLALFCSLALPDICGGLEKSNGKATKNRYIKWYETNMLDQSNLTAAQCYEFRCRMLHQGICGYNQKSLNPRIIFVYPNGHLFFDNNTFKDDNGTVLAKNIDLIKFCTAMISSVRNWEAKMQSNANFIKNQNNLIKIHPNGIPPFFGGFPCIG